MKKKVLQVLLAVTALLTLSCGRTEFYGTYEGTLPAADCPGIQTKLVLNPDTTYELSQVYLETGDDEGFLISGVYEKKNDDLIVLITPSSEERTYYKIIKNTIVLSDSLGTIPQGELADFYVLKKQK